jgi:hypothetical protein
MSLPHRSHHARCPRNRKTRGVSATSVAAEKAATIYLRINGAGLQTALGRRLNAVMPSVAPVFQHYHPYPQLNPAPIVPVRVPPSQPVPPNSEKRPAEESEDNRNGSPASLHDEIEKRIGRLKNGDEVAWLAKIKYPVALVAAIWHIVGLFERRKALQK